MFTKPGEGATPVDPVVIHPETIGEVKGVVEVASPDVFGSGVGVTLPLYDPESFPEADRVKIPAESTFIDHDDLTYKVAVDLVRGRVPMMWGPAGVGKTQLARHLAFLMQVPFERIPLGETSEREDVTGHYELKGSTTEWIQSRLARSFGRPGVTCIDEWNAAPPAVLHVARPVLDDSAQLALDAYDGRILLKHQHNFIIATGTPAWKQTQTDSPTSTWVGRNPLSRLRSCSTTSSPKTSAGCQHGTSSAGCGLGRTYARRSTRVGAP